MLTRLNFPLPLQPMKKQSPISHPLTYRHVAVIGAGAAGLIAARELGREGHSVVVFEQSNQIGGTWVYSSDVESDPLGLDPFQTRIHSSLYRSLRTNLPRELMGCRDYPFVTREGKYRDPRRFPGHGEVLKYLEDFVKDFELAELVRFKTEVVFAGLVEFGKWKVGFRRGIGDGDIEDEFFDAVVVCNGHYSKPRVVEIPGIGEWSGEQMHSHNYRDPESLRDKVVVLIGFSSSGTDICKEVLGVAKEIHVAWRSPKSGLFDEESCFNKASLHPMIQSVRKDGALIFQDGCVVHADVIMHCTGYNYHLPFLHTNGIVTVDDNRVGPLYQHVFPPALAPGLSFVGLPLVVIAFPLYELQSNWIAGVLSNRIMLPSQEEMMADVEAFYSSLRASGIPKHQTHKLGDYQFEYQDWLAATCGCPAYEEWRKQMYFATQNNRLARLESYRDEWHDDELVCRAREEFIKYTSNGRTKIR